MAIYVGHGSGLSCTVFSAKRKPTGGSHGGKYRYATGPFKTKRGADEWCRIYRSGNYVTQTQAENVARDRAAGRFHGMGRGRSRGRHARSGRCQITRDSSGKLRRNCGRGRR